MAAKLQTLVWGDFGFAEISCDFCCRRAMFHGFKRRANNELENMCMHAIFSGFWKLGRKCRTGSQLDESWSTNDDLLGKATQLVCDIESKSHRISWCFQKKEDDDE